MSKNKQLIIVQEDNQEIHEMHIRRVIANCTSHDVLSIEPIQGFKGGYKVNFVPRFHRTSTFAYAYVDSKSSKSAVVFLYDPESRARVKYSAFWIYRQKMVILVEKDTLALAKRILNPIATAVA